MKNKIIQSTCIFFILLTGCSQSISKKKFLDVLRDTINKLSDEESMTEMMWASKEYSNIIDSSSKRKTKKLECDNVAKYKENSFYYHHYYRSSTPDILSEIYDIEDYYIWKSDGKYYRYEYILQPYGETKETKTFEEINEETFLEEMQLNKVMCLSDIGLHCNYVSIKKFEQFIEHDIKSGTYKYDSNKNNYSASLTHNYGYGSSVSKAQSTITINNSLPIEYTFKGSTRERYKEMSFENISFEEPSIINK